MTYDELKILLFNSAAIRLLRAKNAALLLGFLYRAFKTIGRLTIPKAEYQNYVLLGI